MRVALLTLTDVDTFDAANESVWTAPQSSGFALKLNNKVRLKNSIVSSTKQSYPPLAGPRGTAGSEDHLSPPPPSLSSARDRRPYGVSGRPPGWPSDRILSAAVNNMCRCVPGVGSHPAPSPAALHSRVPSDVRWLPLSPTGRPGGQGCSWAALRRLSGLDAMSWGVDSRQIDHYLRCDETENCGFYRMC